MRLFGLSAIVAVLVPARLLVHTRLTHSTPGKGEVVQAAPKQVELYFSERPDVALTTVTLLGADSTPVARLEVAPAMDTLGVVGTVPIALTPGKYVIAWRTASRDGHKVRGQFPFTYTPAATSAPSR